MSGVHPVFTRPEYGQVELESADQRSEKSQGDGFFDSSPLSIGTPPPSPESSQLGVASADLVQVRVQDLDEQLKRWSESLTESDYYDDMATSSPKMVEDAQRNEPGTMRSLLRDSVKALPSPRAPIASLSLTTSRDTGILCWHLSKFEGINDCLPAYVCLTSV